jgi:raffinose/stachyose/melibiose transport system substrate-binding protein
MKSSIKTAILLGCGLFTSLVFLSCSKKSSESAETTTKSKVPKSVILTMMIATNDTKEGLNAVIAKTKEKFGIDVEFDLTPGGEELNNLIRSRCATGDLTDLVWYNSGSLFTTLGPKDYFYDLTDKPYVANYDEAYKSTVSVDGRTYGIPGSSSGAGVWLYNKKLCDELGLRVPLTWRELMENCDIIKKAGKVAILGAYGSGWPAVVPLYADEYNVVAQVPGFPHLYTQNKIKYATTPVALRGFEKTLDASKYFNADYNACTYDQAMEMLVKGEGAYWPMLSGALSTIYSIYPDQIDNIGAFAQPGDDPELNGLTIWMPSSIYINKDSPNLEEAITFVDYYILNPSPIL